MTKEKKSSAKSLMSNILEGATHKNTADKTGHPDPANKRATFSHIEKKAKKRKTQMVTTMWVDPGKCRIQERPNRFYELLTPERCSDLIASIEGQGQQIPAIARQTGEPDKPYEIIVGRRRHYAASYLGVDILIDVRVVTDEEAFLLSEAENEGREDLSDLEKAYDWADALVSFYNGKVARLAVAINKTRPTVYEYLDLASLDKKIIDAYSSPLDVKKGHAKKLVSLLKDEGAKKRILERAAELSKENGFSGASVFKELVSAGASSEKRGGFLVNENITNSDGKLIFNITKNRQGSVNIKISNKHKLKNDELIKLIGEAINNFV